MMPSIKEIRACRKNLGLTQAELSESSSVSQSLIAKIESGKIMPSYEKARKIFAALHQAQEKKSITARDIMSRKLKHVKENDTAKKAVATMEKHGFSQLPVLSEGKCVGAVTEHCALSGLRKLGLEKFNSLKVSEIMEEALPVVSEQASFPMLAGMLDHTQALLVSHRGKIVGIITKTNILKSTLRKRQN